MADMDWLGDINDTVNSWFSSDVKGDFWSDAPIENDWASTGTQYLEQPLQEGYDQSPFDDFLTGDDQWDNSWEIMFEVPDYSAGLSESSDSGLLGSIMDFANTKLGTGLIGGALQVGGQALRDKANREYMEKQAELAHQRALAQIAARGGAGEKPPGRAEATTSSLASNLVRR